MLYITRSKFLEQYLINYGDNNKVNNYRMVFKEIDNITVFLLKCGVNYKSMLKYSISYMCDEAVEYIVYDIIKNKLNAKDILNECAFTNKQLTNIVFKLGSRLNERNRVEKQICKDFGRILQHMIVKHF